MKRVQSAGDEIAISIDARESRIMWAALREALEALDDWEFETRTGFPRAEIQCVLDDLIEVLGPPST